MKKKVKQYEPEFIECGPIEWKNSPFHDKLEIEWNGEKVMLSRETVNKLRRLSLYNNFNGYFDEESEADIYNADPPPKKRFTDKGVKYYITSEMYDYNSKYCVVEWTVYNYETDDWVITFKDDSPYTSVKVLVRHVDGLSYEEANALQEVAEQYI